MTKKRQETADMEDKDRNSCSCADKLEHEVEVQNPECVVTSTAITSFT